MKMNSRILLLFLVFVFGVSFKQTQSTNEIYWQPNQYIQWNDFKGTPNVNSNLIALSTVGFKVNFSWEGKNRSAAVYAVFYQNDSWTKVFNTTETELLKHEQLHFDITELFARKLRKELSKRKFKSKYVNKEIQCVVDRLEREKNDYQNLYDKETKHSQSIKQQIDWEKSVAVQLEELREYATAQVLIKLR